MNTARQRHPGLAHKLDPKTGMKIFADGDFQSECNAVFV